MFRDGRPFNQQDVGASAAESLFPPPPPTIVGAIRAGLARQIDGGSSPWPKDALGHGVNWQDEGTSLGELRFGPLLIRRKAGLLFPAPAHLCKDRDGRIWLLEVRAPTKFRSDLGPTVVFPQEPAGAKGVKVLEGAWIDSSGLSDVLNGKAPESTSIVDEDKLMKRESKAGIGIDVRTRVVNDAQLYAASFLRLRDDVEFLLPCEGAPVPTEDFTQRLGGEQRAAQFHLAEIELDQSASTKLDGLTEYAAVAVSPVYLKKEPYAGGPIPGLSGTLVSAAIPKPFRLGGWSSMENGPLPMTPIIPAGAVFFMACTEDESPKQPNASIGYATKWGFGHCFLGKWPGNREVDG